MFPAYSFDINSANNVKTVYSQYEIGTPNGQPTTRDTVFLVSRYSCEYKK